MRWSLRLSPRGVLGILGSGALPAVLPVQDEMQWSQENFRKNEALRQLLQGSTVTFQNHTSISHVAEQSNRSDHETI